MKPLILSAATILTLGLINTTPALAQTQQITCIRERNMITCPNYGSFRYSSNNNNRKATNISCSRNRNVINCPNYGSFRYSSNNNANRNQEINNLYIQVLGRNANINELNRYRQALNKQGWSLAKVRSSLANSQEFNQIVNKVYQQYLGRNADADGLRSYRNVIISGRSFEDIRNDISNSAEARSRNNNGNYYPNDNVNRQQEINNLYIQVLGRNANNNEFRSYDQMFNNRSYSLTDARRNLVNSQEFGQSINNLYREYLGRNADADGLQSYRNAVINGMSFEEARNEIANSPEARSRSNNSNYYPNNTVNHQQEINTLYIQVLGRNANSDELRSYDQMFNNRSYSLADARRNLVNSQEFTQAINNLYREYLGRNVDNNGLQSYRNAVTNGMSFEEVRNEIANSPEAGNGNSNDYDNRSNAGGFLENMLCEVTGFCR